MHNPFSRPGGRLARRAIGGLVVALALTSSALAQDQTIRILISQSPWLNAFVALVGQYQKQTGNKIALDVTPFGGMLEKARNSVRGQTGNYDIVNLNSDGVTEFYAGGFLEPLKQIDPKFSVPKGVMDFGGALWWNDKTQSYDAQNGELLSLPSNGNVQVLFYRTDLYQQKGLKVPTSWDELLANSKALQSSSLYGFVPRAARDSIVYNFTPYLFSYGGSWFKDPEHGDYSISLNSPAGLNALQMYIQLGKEAGPPNPGAVAQAQLIQLLATGKAASAVAVVAAWAQLEDPDSSVVVGKIGTALLPAGPGGKSYSTAGPWFAGIPKNVSADHQKAALDFLEWFLSKDVQVAYVKAGGVPVRLDLGDTSVASDPAYAWLKAFSANAANAVMYMPLKEGDQISDTIALYLNKAVIGQMSPKDALNGAAADSNKILVDAGYKVTPPGKL